MKKDLPSVPARKALKFAYLLWKIIVIIYDLVGRDLNYSKNKSCPFPLKTMIIVT